uniref:Putative group vi salivary lipocalin n=1 Tax=Rhipicephalus microplus TaxID=6941 RepID=A0A6G5A6J6_RHIMP
MQLFLYVVLSGAVGAVRGQTSTYDTERQPPWVNEAFFFKYQNAWRAISNTSVTYTLIKTTYKNVDGYHRDITCVNVTTTYIHFNPRRVTAKANYRVQGVDTTANYTIWPVKRKDYNKTYNAVQYEEKEEKSNPNGLCCGPAPEPTEGVIIFSDPILAPS